MTLVTFVEYWIFLWACWPPGDAEVDILESAPLEMEGEACLEFWYRAPFAAEGSELRALVKSSTRLVEIWTSPALPGDSWRQVFIPLNIIEPETKVKWHICNHKVANLTPFLLVNSRAFRGRPFHTKSWHYRLSFFEHSITFPSLFLETCCQHQIHNKHIFDLNILSLYGILIGYTLCQQGLANDDFLFSIRLSLKQFKQYPWSNRSHFTG